MQEQPLVLFADLQEGIGDRGRTNDRKHVEKNAVALAKLAKIFRLPVIVTTVPGSDGAPPKLLAALADELRGITPLQRMTTDSFDDAAIRAAIEATGRKTILIAGVVTEVAVERPALSGVKLGYDVQVVVDACDGLSERSEEAAFRRMTAAGVTLTSVGAVVGELAADFSQPQAREALGVLMSL